VKHGGRRVRFSTTNGFEWISQAGSPGFTWQPRTAMADTIANATRRSRRGLSHGWHRTPYTDTTVTVTRARISPTQERFTVLLNGVQLAQINGPLAQGAVVLESPAPCVSWWVNDPQMNSCLEFAATRSFRDSITTSFTAAMSPAGDTVVLAIAQDSFSFHVDPALGDGTKFYRPNGFYDKTIGTDLWFIPVGGGTPRGPVRVPNRVENVGPSEDNRFLLLNTRNRYFLTVKVSEAPATTSKLNQCSADYFFNTGQFLLGSPFTRHSLASTAACVPGSMFAP
jgi:hypothetical protein